MEKKNKLFTVGPVEMEKELRELNNEGLAYFRTDEFSEFMIELEKKVLKLSKASKRSKCAFLTASGTAGMEAGLINLFNEESKVLVVNGGSFGQRFVEICQIHGIPFSEVKLEKGKCIKEEDLDAYRSKGYTGLIINAHETSTGVLHDMEMIGKFCKEQELLLVVDAISSFIADEYRMTDWGINATVLSSQKAIGVSPGISIVILDEKAIEVTLANKPKTMYLDLKLYLKNMERGQTPFTPDIGALKEIDFRLNEIISKGLDIEQKRIKGLAEYFRNEVKDLPLEIFPDKSSNLLTAIKVLDESKSAYALYRKLREEYNITVLPSGGEAKESFFRVGHIGELKLEDIKRLVEVLKKELGEK